MVLNYSEGEEFISGVLTHVEYLLKKGEEHILVLITEYQNRFNFYKKNKEMYSQTERKKIEKSLMELEEEISAEIQWHYLQY